MHMYSLNKLAKSVALYNVIVIVMPLFSFKIAPSKIHKFVQDLLDSGDVLVG